MPLFEYECEKCGNRFEKLVLHASDKVKCTMCFSDRVKKLFSPFSIEIADAICGKVPKGELRDYCKECRHGGAG